MTRHLNRRRSRAIALAVCFTLLFSGSSSAFASPGSRIEDAKKRAAQASDKLDELAADLEERNEEYLEVEAALDETRRRITIGERDLESATAELNAANVQLTHRVESIYRDGPIDVLSVFLGVTDFSDFVSRLDIMQRIGRSDAVIVIAVRQARNHIESAQQALKARRDELTSLREQARIKKDEVASAFQAQEQYLTKVNSEVRQLIAEEKQRREREAARRAAEIARKAAQNWTAGMRSLEATTLGPPHGEAVAVARRFVNKTWYRWGGTTPAGFDCSGLVQYAYREIGINIPRTSRQQYRIGAFIPPDRLDLLAPGDLVFFGRNGDPGRVHHVAMYIGEGKMIHAPQTGQRVSVGSLLDRIESRGDYVGGCRP